MPQQSLWIIIISLQLKTPRITQHTTDDFSRFLWSVSQFRKSPNFCGQDPPPAPPVRGQKKLKVGTPKVHTAHICPNHRNCVVDEISRPIFLLLLFLKKDWRCKKWQKGCVPTQKVQVEWLASHLWNEKARWSVVSGQPRQYGAIVIKANQALFIHSCLLLLRQNSLNEGLPFQNTTFGTGVL